MKEIRRVFQRIKLTAINQALAVLLVCLYIYEMMVVVEFFLFAVETRNPQNKDLFFFFSYFES